MYSFLAALARNRQVRFGAEHRVPAMTSATSDVAEEVVWSDERIGQSAGPRTVTSVLFTPDVAVAGAATNNFQVTVNQRSATGTLVGVVAQLVFGAGTNAPAFVPASVPVTGNASIGVGGTLTVTITHNGTGIAAPASLLRVEVAS